MMDYGVTNILTSHGYVGFERHNLLKGADAMAYSGIGDVQRGDCKVIVVIVMVIEMVMAIMLC